MGGKWAMWHKEPNLSEYFKSPIFTQRYEPLTGAYLHFFFSLYAPRPLAPSAPFQFKYEKRLGAGGAGGGRRLLNQNGSCQNVKTWADDTLPPSAVSAQGQRVPSTRLLSRPVTYGEPPDSVLAEPGNVTREEEERMQTPRAHQRMGNQMLFDSDTY